METFLYNTITQQREGPIRQGRYLVDGKPGPIPEDWVELVITIIPDPSYNPDIQTIEYREFADLINFLWIKEPFVRNLSEQEINDRKPKPPDSCTPRQFRMALLEFNIDIDYITNMINNIQDAKSRKIALIEWEYSIEIKREHPLIKSFATELNITEEQINQIFILANTFD